MPTEYRYLQPGHIESTRNAIDALREARRDYLNGNVILHHNDHSAHLTLTDEEVYHRLLIPTR